MGVIKAFKNHYCNILIKFLIYDFKKVDVGHFAKINLKDVTIFVSMTWDRVSTDTIKNCFAKAFESCRNYELASVDNDDPLDELIPEAV